MAFPALSSSQHLLNQVALSNSIRRLWADNIQWTRALMISAIYDRGDQQALIARLRQNAEDFATVFGQFYPQPVVNQLRQYINNEVDGVIRLIEAYKNYDDQAIREAREFLYANADETASYFARSNRYLDLPTIQVMLHDIINLLEQEIMLIRDGQFVESIRKHDELTNRVYTLSDELTYGILKQFQV